MVVITEVVAILAATEAEAMEVKEMGITIEEDMEDKEMAITIEEDMEVKEMGTITTEVMMETGVEVSGENVDKEEDIREEVAVVEGDKEVA